MQTENIWQLPHVILASRSPRRQELLCQIGVPFDVVEVNIDETPWLNEAPADYVQRLAVQKALAGQSIHVAHSACPVLGSDTTVVFNGQILEKPRDEADGARMLQLLSGQTHEVLTAVAIAYGEQQWQALSVNQVTFRTISPDEIQRYWASEEPQDKAGGYAVQGLAATFIEHIAGSYSGIMGLPLFETTQLLQQLSSEVRMA